jgi:hypothetical protein
VRKTIVGFGVFVVIVAITAACIAIFCVDDKSSTEIGAFALRLRIIEIALLAIGAGSVLLLIEQLALTARWNRRLSYHQFFPELPTAASRAEFVKLADRLKIDSHHKNEPLPLNICKALIDNGPDKQVVFDYLNDFEEFACAVRRQLVDPNYAYDLESLRVERAWHVFQPFVTKLRELVVYAGSYSELEDLAQEWAKKTESLRGKPSPPLEKL